MPLDRSTLHRVIFAISTKVIPTISKRLLTLRGALDLAVTTMPDFLAVTYLVASSAVVPGGRIPVVLVA